MSLTFYTDLDKGLSICSNYQMFKIEQRILWGCIPVRNNTRKIFESFKNNNTFDQNQELFASLFWTT